MKLDVINTEGKTVRAIDADDLVFGIKPRPAVVHQVFVAQRANQRQGTHKTKTRGEVRGSTVKLYRQKGTGRARQGARRAPHRRGGGTVFGPQPRSYRQRLPKRVRRLAVRSILSAKAADGTLRVIEELALDAPKTKAVQTILQNAGLTRSTLVITAGRAEVIKRSIDNLPNVLWLPAPYLNALDLLNHQGLLMTEAAVRTVEAYWGSERATKRRASVPEVPHA